MSKLLCLKCEKSGLLVNVFDQKWLPKWMKSDNVGGEIVQILIGFSIHIER